MMRGGVVFMVGGGVQKGWQLREEITNCYRAGWHSPKNEPRGPDQTRERSRPITHSPTHACLSLFWVERQPPLCGIHPPQHPPRLPLPSFDIWSVALANIRGDWLKNKGEQFSFISSFYRKGKLYNPPPRTPFNL